MTKYLKIPTPIFIALLFLIITPSASFANKSFTKDIDLANQAIGKSSSLVKKRTFKNNYIKSRIKIYRQCAKEMVLKNPDPEPLLNPLSKMTLFSYTSPTIESINRNPKTSSKAITILKNARKNIGSKYIKKLLTALIAEIKYLKSLPSSGNPCLAIKELEENNYQNADRIINDMVGEKQFLIKYIKMLNKRDRIGSNLLDRAVDKGLGSKAYNLYFSPYTVVYDLLLNIREGDGYLLSYGGSWTYQTSFFIITTLEGQ